MIITSLKNIELFKIADEKQNKYYGGCQKWYSTRWKRLSGCGPTVVSNIMNYLRRSKDEMENKEPIEKRRFQELMEEVWKHVTPTIGGIPNTNILLKGSLSYIKAKGLDIKPEAMDIHEAANRRPEFISLLDFIAGALKTDAPIAFLNLNNGDEKDLDSWHWVTIISMQYEEDGSAAHIEFIDEGKITKINLLNWFKTTTLGGGLVSFG